MMNRREFLERCTAAGVGETLLPGALAALAVQSASAEGSAENGSDKSTPSINAFPAITAAMLDAAAVIAGITLTDAQKKQMLAGVTEQRATIQAIRDLRMPNSVSPAVIFDPLPSNFKAPAGYGAARAVQRGWGH